MAAKQRCVEASVNQSFGGSGSVKVECSIAVQTDETQHDKDNYIGPCKLRDLKSILTSNSF